MTKEEKSEYDREYRIKNKERIRLRNKAYNESEAGRAMQKRSREKRKQYHNEYCRKPEQREKEKNRRHIRENKLKLKHCIGCSNTKPIICFESWSVSKDGRHYLCKDCENKHKKVYGCSTRNVITAMVMRPYTNLKREDLLNHPYLIEANKFLILLKQLTK